jgi:hypothetical protein
MNEFDYSGQLREMNRVMFNLGRTSIEDRLNFSMEDYRKEAAAFDISVRALLNQLLDLLKVGRYPIVELTDDRITNELLLISNSKDPTFLESWVYFENKLDSLNLDFSVWKHNGSHFIHLKNV